MIIDRRKKVQRLGVTQAVSGEVEVDRDTVASEINHIGRTRAVDIGEAETLGVELVGQVEPR